MPSSWQEHLLEKLVVAAHAAGDGRLATVKLHRRKRTVSLQHPQMRRIECSPSVSRNPRSQAQVLLIECQPRRPTELDGSALKRELHEAGCRGDVQFGDQAVWFQCQRGHGAEAVFPVHDARRVKELTSWATRALALLLNHLERRRHVVVPVVKLVASSTPLDLRVALEQYLEDLLVGQWVALPWAAELEYVGRQVQCGELGRIDILARDRTSGDYVVVELKRDRGDDEVVGQLSRYMGWITQHRAGYKGVGVRGMIVAHEATDRLQAAVLAHSNMALYTYTFAVALVPIPSQIHAATETN